MHRTGRMTISLLAHGRDLLSMAGSETIAVNRLPPGVRSRSGMNGSRPQWDYIRCAHAHSRTHLSRCDSSAPWRTWLLRALPRWTRCVGLAKQQFRTVSVPWALPTVSVWSRIRSNFASDAACGACGQVSASSAWALHTHGEETRFSMAPSAASGPFPWWSFSIEQPIGMLTCAEHRRPRRCQVRPLPRDSVVGAESARDYLPCMLWSSPRFGLGRSCAVICSASARSRSRHTVSFGTLSVRQ